MGMSFDDHGAFALICLRALVNETVRGVNRRTRACITQMWSWQSSASARAVQAAAAVDTYSDGLKTRQAAAKLAAA